MRVLWTHNFDPLRPNSGVFMYILADGLKQQGVQLDFQYLGNLRSPRELWRAIKHLKQVGQEYDIVHAQFGSACALATSYVKEVPKVVSLRGSDWNVFSESFNFYYWHTRLARTLTHFSLRRYNTILTVSKKMTNAVQQAFPDKTCYTIPSPIDLVRFRPENKDELRKKLGYSGNTEKWILFNSNDLKKPIKRYQLALNAFEIARKKLGNIRLRIANNIPHSTIPDFVASCDLILCTSTAEGWPNSVKEALACNIPFVSTDVSDLSEIASKEASCRICPPDPVILADAICDVLSMPPDHRLRQYIEDMNVDNTCRKLLDVYNQTLEKI